MSERFSDPNTILSIVRSLLQKKVFSLHPENVIIERVDRPAVYPCGQLYPRGLNLDQLEWAAKEGHFWFLGPIQTLRIILDKGSVQGDLELEANRIKFITSLSTLNYRELESFAERLRETARRLELEIEFESMPDHNIKLVVESMTFPSANNVNEFIDKLHLLHQSTDKM